MKNIHRITALLTILIPASAFAVTYEPNYTCYYRDVSGSCMSYQTSSPYTPQGNQHRHPKVHTYNYPQYTQYPYAQDAWKYGSKEYIESGNPYYSILRYEDDDDGNDYLDEDDDAYEYFYGKKDDDDFYVHWKWYYDEDDNVYRPYLYQNSNLYPRWYYDGYQGYGQEEYVEYQTRYVRCTGGNCEGAQY